MSASQTHDHSDNKTFNHDHSKPWFPLAGGQNDGWSSEDEASASCFCGSVQLGFPTSGPGFLGTFICHCTDCRKLTAATFASNFTVTDPYLKHIRGKDNLSTYATDRTIGSHKTMTNYFCKTCGTLMYRVGAAYPGAYFMRVGTVDDFSLHETKLGPQLEQFVQNRLSWMKPIEGVKQFDGMFDA